MWGRNTFAQNELFATGARLIDALNGHNAVSVKKIGKPDARGRLVGHVTVSG